MKEIPFRIYYDGGKTFNGDPYDAPAFGVLVIVEKDKDNGRNLVMGKDYYCYDSGKWYSVDFIGMIDYLQSKGAKKVLFGRTVESEYWYSIVKKANEDPDFPTRTAWGTDERIIT